MKCAALLRGRCTTYASSAAASAARTAARVPGLKARIAETAAAAGGGTPAPLAALSLPRLPPLLLLPPPPPRPASQIGSGGVYKTQEVLSLRDADGVVTCHQRGTTHSKGWCVVCGAFLCREMTGAFLFFHTGRCA